MDNDTFNLKIQPQSTNVDSVWRSKEHATSTLRPKLQITPRIFRVASITIRNTRYVLYDFESNTLLLTNLSTIFNDPSPLNLEGVYDFVYDAKDNILKTGGTIGSQKQKAGSENFFLPIPNDAIETTICNGQIYNTDPIYDLNQFSYTKICFQLKDQHNQRNFFGVWMMLNNTCPASDPIGCFFGTNVGRDVDLRLGFLSSFLFSISFIDIIPSDPQVKDNVKIRSISTTNATGYVQYRYAPANSLNFSDQSIYSSWFTINDTGNKLLHEIIIPTVIEDKYYQFFVYGINNDGNIAIDNNTDSFYNFTVGARGIFGEGNGTAGLPVVLDRLAEHLGLDFSTATYIFGLIILFICTGVAWFKGGMHLGLAVLTVLTIAESLIGLLPFYLFIPLVVIAGLLITNMVRKSITGGG